MAKEVASIFLSSDFTQWDVEQNHHRCICHVIALILGAGLKALKLSRKILQPEKTDQHFPTLATITEEKEVEDEEEIVELTDTSDEEEIDPDDAVAETPEANSDLFMGDDVDYSTSGIGLTLKKVGFRFSFDEAHGC
jgi:hypothetical protein